jgi:hypothetical protein
MRKTSDHRILSRVRGDHEPPLLKGQDARKFAGVLPDGASGFFAAIGVDADNKLKENTNFRLFAA